MSQEVYINENISKKKLRRKVLVATGSFWLLQEASGYYRTLLVATGRSWLLQKGTGCYRKLLVVPVKLFL